MSSYPSPGWLGFNPTTVDHVSVALAAQHGCAKTTATNKMAAHPTSTLIFYFIWSFLLVETRTATVDKGDHRKPGQRHADKVLTGCTVLLSPLKPQTSSPKHPEQPLRRWPSSAMNGLPHGMLHQRDALPTFRTVMAAKPYNRPVGSEYNQRSPKSIRKPTFMNTGMALHIEPHKSAPYTAA